MVQALLRDFQDVEHATTLGWIAATSDGADPSVARGAQRVLPGSSVIFDVQLLCSGGLHGGDEAPGVRAGPVDVGQVVVLGEDRKSTRLNSSHVAISYAVFCLKKTN